MKCFSVPRDSVEEMEMPDRSFIFLAVRYEEDITALTFSHTTQSLVRGALRADNGSVALRESAFGFTIPLNGSLNGPRRAIAVGDGGELPNVRGSDVSLTRSHQCKKTKI